MTCVLGKNSITCYRCGYKVPKGRVKDRQGNTWEVYIDRSQFERAPAVEVHRDGIRKRYLREFLTWVD